MKVIFKKLDKFTLNKYLEKYGFDFFHKLRRYSTCSVDVEENGLTKIQYFYIDSINKDNELILSDGSCFNNRKQIQVNWFDCWDFVL